MPYAVSSGERPPPPVTKLEPGELASITKTTIHEAISAAVRG
jgi:hypothetical protein